MSRVTMLMPDLDRLLGADSGAVQQMVNIAAELDTQGALPAPAFVPLTPGVRGHGEAWLHAGSGLVVVRADHHPVLLTTTVCATCGTKHMDVAHAYLFGSPRDIQVRAYARYVDAQIDLPSPASE